MSDHILIADDDPYICQALIRSLTLEGFVAKSVSNGESAIQEVENNNPRILILDINMPKINGIEVIKYLRSIDIDIPICVLSARDEVSDRVKGLESGADDYLAKPLVRAEVVARLNALLRRTAHRDSQVDYQFGAYRIDPKRKQLLLEGEVLPLTQREFDLAFYLFQHQDTLVRRDQALAAVWGQSAELTTRTVDNHVSRLRRKLRTEQTHWRLTAVYQQGYRLESPGHNVTPYTHD